MCRGRATTVGAQDLIGGYRQPIARARQGFAIYGATLTPFSGTAFPD